MLHNTDTAGGVAATSSPGIIYTVLTYLLDVPIDKWASAFAIGFVILQTVFLLIDRRRKRLEREVNHDA